MPQSRLHQPCVVGEAVGPLRVAALADGGWTGLRITGEIDLVSHDVWEQALRGALAGHAEDVHLDLTGLRFIDAGGATRLVQIAAS